MGNLFGKILKGLVYTAAAAVMLLALLVGIARLLLPLVPEYQDNIRQWAAQATGFDVQFENISASWPFAGPELLFIDVTVSAPDNGEQILTADTLTVGVSLLGLIRDRKALLSRIGVEGAQVRVRRDADGAVWIQGRPLDSFLDPERDPDAPLRLPELSISLSSIGILFTDVVRSNDEYLFAVEQMEITLAPVRASIDGEVDLPAEFGKRAMLAAELPIELLRPESAAPDNINPRGVIRPATPWRLFVDGEDLRLDRLLRFALNRDVSVTEARGDVTISAAFADRAPVRISAELDLSGVGLRVGETRTWRYEAFSGRVEWAREPNGGWLLAGTDISVEQRDLFLPRSDFAVVMQPGATDASQTIKIGASYLRLHDLYPLIKAAENERWLTNLPDDLSLPLEIFGEVQGFDLTLQRSASDATRFNVAAQFADLGVVGLPSGNSVRFVSGTLAADQDGGFVQLDSDATEIEMPGVFPAPIRTQRISGLLRWSVNAEVIRVNSDDLSVSTPHGAIDSQLRFDWPRNGDSPWIDLQATATASDNREVVPLLPLRRFPEPVGNWLGRAIVAGRIPQAAIEINGPLRSFPFAAGEGVFHIEVDIADGVLDYAARWPRIEGIDATIVFDGVSLTSQRNSGRLGGLGFRDADVRIVDLRKGQLEISGRQALGVRTGLDFLRATPVADAIGRSLLNKVTGTGAVSADLQLAVPVMRPEEFDLQLLLEPGGATLGMQGLGWGLTDVRGTLTVRNTQFFADGLTATLLDEPVTIDLYPAADSNELFGQFVRVAGRTPIERWMQTLSLPFAGRVDGPADWDALVLIPRRDPETQAPVHIQVRSDLAGVESRLPEPLAKTAEQRDALELDIAFPADKMLEVTGRLRRDLTWALELDSVADRWRLGRGAVHAGSAAAILPAEPGIEVSGRLARLRFDDWLALTADGEGEGDGSGLHETWREVIVDIDRLSVFGRLFADVQLEARHDDRDWLLTVEAPNAAGRIAVPFDLDAGRPIDVDMLRLWLQDTEPESDAGEDADPRTWPAINVAVADFVLRDMRLGALNTRIAKVAGGVVAEPIQIEGGTFTINGNGAWLVHPNDDALRQSRVALNLSGKNIAAVLAALGYQPVIEGKSLTVGGELTWLGGPDEGFLERADGKISMRMDEGSLLAVEPGSGRLLGVLSLAALPRRLSFDFSDVFDDGLGFDTIKGDFTIDDGNAYTCNLGMEGSVADMGVVGRTGLGARDYDQLAVVRPHVSNLLAVGGVVVGGPAAGAAMLLFSQIFRKPLSTLGESYYRVKGSWDDPSVEQIQGNALDAAPLRNCEAYLAEAISESLKP